MFWCALLIRFWSCGSWIFMLSHTISARLWFMESYTIIYTAEQISFEILTWYLINFPTNKNSWKRKKIRTNSQFYPCCFDKCCKTVSKNWKKDLSRFNQRYQWMRDATDVLASSFRCCCWCCCFCIHYISWILTLCYALNETKTRNNTLNAVGAHRCIYVHDNFMPGGFYISLRFVVSEFTFLSEWVCVYVLCSFMLTYLHIHCSCFWPLFPFPTTIRFHFLL